MSDPLDTDALRATAKRIDDRRDTPLPTVWSDARDSVNELRAAADELDRLRAELDAWEPAWRNMRDQRDRARAVIENAPHEDLCMTNIPAEKGPYCNCWKVDALN